MIRRDRHVALVLGAMLLLNVATAVSSTCCVFVYRRRFRDLSSALLASAKASEHASVEAAATTMALADRFGQPASYGPVVASPPRVVGYGQTRSKRAVWIYRDVEQDGVVHREFLTRMPFSLKSDKTDPGSSHP